VSRDFTIRGALLLDNRHDHVRADVRVRAGRIDRIAPSLPPDPIEVSAEGLVLAPGFIDLHCHSDFAALVYPRAESKVLAGVTTDVSGNCGLSPFPLAGEFLDRRRAEWAPKGLRVDWSSAAEYFDRAEAAPSSVNRVLLVGHGAIRAAAVGYADRPATAGERRTMRRLLTEALEAGAFGLSSGLIYPPGCWADVEELADLAAVVAEAGGLYTSHIRSEGDRLLEAVDEFLAVVRRSGVRGHLSHLKAAGRANWSKAPEAVRRLRQARDDGLAVTADRYPYLASMTDLGAMLLPPWALEGGREAELARLAEPAVRRRLAEEVRRAHPEPDYFDRILIAEVGPEVEPEARPSSGAPSRVAGAGAPAAEAVGMTLRELGEAHGADPLEAAFDLLRRHRMHVAAIHHSMSEENLRLILCFGATGCTWPPSTTR